MVYVSWNLEWMLGSSCIVFFFLYLMDVGVRS